MRILNYRLFRLQIFYVFLFSLLIFLLSTFYNPLTNQFDTRSETHASLNEVVAKIRADCSGQPTPCYTSLVAWEAAWGGVSFGGGIGAGCPLGDLVCAQKSAVAEIYNDWPSGLTEILNIDGWVTNANYNIQVRVAAGQNHRGVVGGGFYLNGNIVTSAPYTVIDGVEIKGGFMATYQGTAPASTGDGTKISNCIVHGLTALDRALISSEVINTTVTIENCVLFGLTNSGSLRRGLISVTGANIRNVTGGNTNVHGIEAIGSVDVRNTVMGPCTESCFSGIFAPTSDNNVSADDTAPGAVTAKNKTDYLNYFDKLHLKDTSQILWGISGQNLSSNFATDFEGQARVNWDIGADEYYAPTPPPPPPPPACSDGIDNDGDSLIDYPSDPGCTDSQDTDETNAPPGDLCTDSIQDKLNHPMDNSIPRPEYLVPFKDPVFGNTIRRITNVNPAEGWDAVIIPVYSTMQAWNADESKMILWHRGSGKGHELYDGKTYQYIRLLPISPTDLEHVLWDPVDPDILYYPSARNNYAPDFYRYRVSTDTREIIRNFTDLGCPTGNAGVRLSLGSDPMYMSWYQSKVVGLQCGDLKFLYDIPGNRVISTRVDTGQPNAPQMGPSGKFFNAGGDIWNDKMEYVRKLDLESAYEHASVGQTNGRDAYNTVVFGGSDSGSLINFYMDTGEKRHIIAESLGWPYPRSTTHMSAIAYKNPDWVAVSQVGDDYRGQSILSQEVVLANTSTRQVCRLAHHHSYSGSVPPPNWGYWSEPHVSISPSGTRMIFASDWQNGDSVNTYVIELNSYVPPEPPDTVPPSNPGNFQGVAISGSQVNLSWTEATDNKGISGYRLFRDRVKIAEVPATVLTYSDAGLTPNTTYEYGIIAVDLAGNRSSGVVVQVTTLPDQGDTEPPIISNIQVSNITTVSASISWQTNELTTGLVEYGVTPAYGNTISSGPTPQTSHWVSLKGLQQDTLYHYRIQATDTSSNQSLSIDQTFRTLGSPDTTPPGVPTDFRVTALYHVAMDLAWSAPGDDDYQGQAALYEMRYSRDPITADNFDQAIPANGLPIPSPARSPENYTLIGMKPETTYYIALRAIDDAGNKSMLVFISDKTKEPPAPPPPGQGGGGEDTIPPDPVTNFRVSIGDKQALLTWKNPTNEDFVRVVIVRTEKIPPESIKDGMAVYEGKGVQFTDDKLENGKIYYYGIASFDRNLNYSKLVISKEVIPVEGEDSFEVPDKRELLPDKTLIRKEEDIKVYVIQRGKRRWITTAQIFLKLGYKFSDVKSLKADEFSLYEEGLPISKIELPSGRFIQLRGVTQVWEIVKGRRKLILPANQSKVDEYTDEGVKLVTPFQLNRYPRVSLVKVKGDYKVYYVTELGLVRHIPTLAAFNGYRFNFRQVLEISPEELNSYPRSQLIVVFGQNELYQLDENGVIHHVPTPDVFKSKGYRLQDIVRVSHLEFSVYPRGADIQ